MFIFLDELRCYTYAAGVTFPPTPLPTDLAPVALPPIPLPSTASSPIVHPFLARDTRTSAFFQEPNPGGQDNLYYPPRDGSIDIAQRNCASRLFRQDVSSILRKFLQQLPLALRHRQIPQYRHSLVRPRLAARLLSDNFEVAYMEALGLCTYLRYAT